MFLLGHSVCLGVHEKHEKGLFEKVNSGDIETCNGDPLRRPSRYSPANNFPMRGSFLRMSGIRF